MQTVSTASVAWRALFACALLSLALSCLFSVSDAKKVVISWGNKNYTGSVSTQGAHQLPQELFHPISGASLPSFADVVSKRDLTLALAESGELWLWGMYGDSRLLPRNVSSTLLPPEPLVKIDAAGFSFFGLSASGKVYSWSWNAYFPKALAPILGRVLPDPLVNQTAFLTSVHQPSLVHLNDSTAPLTSFACSDSFCLGYDGIVGRLQIWTDNSSTTLSSLALSSYLSSLNGSIDSSLPFLVSIPFPQQKVISIAPGYNWFFVTTDSGDILSCGVNDVGQLGLSTMNATAQFMAVHENAAELKAMYLSSAGGDPPLSVSAGRSHALYLVGSASQTITPDGHIKAVYGWGSNAYNQLGNFTGANTAVPTPIYLPTIDPVVKVSAVFDGSFALTGFGAIYAWGSSRRCDAAFGCGENGFGLLGGPLAYNFVFPTPFQLSLPGSVLALSLPTQSLSPMENQDLTPYWTRWAMQFIALDNSPSVTPSASSSAQAPETVSNWGRTSQYSHNAFPITYEASAPSGDPTANDQDLAQLLGPHYASLPPNVVTIKQVSHQRDSTRVLANVLRVDGTQEQRLFAWGALESPLSPPLMTLTVPTPPHPSSSSNITDHSMAFSSAPIDLTPYLYAPQGTSSTNITSMSLQLNSMAVLLGDGSLQSYFQNTPADASSAHNLGGGWNVSSPTTRLECGDLFCMLLDGGSEMAYVWMDKLSGASTNPLVGRADWDQVSTPPTIPAPANISGSVLDIAAGEGFAVAVTNDTNAVWTWGDAVKGQGQVRVSGVDFGYEPLPINVSLVDGFTSVPFVGQNIRGVCAGRAHVLVIIGQYQIVAWGENLQGQVGPFSFSSSVMPSVISSLPFFPGTGNIPATINRVACIRDTSFAHTYGGIFVWGFNGAGQVFGPGLYPDVFSSSSFFSSSLPTTSTAFSVSPSGNVVNRIWSSPTAYSVVTSVFTSASSSTSSSVDQSAANQAAYPILAFGLDYDAHFPLTFESSELALGSPTVVGELPLTTTVQWFTSTALVRYYVTSDLNIYAAGDLEYMPAFADIPYTTASPPSTRDVIIPRPRLLYSYPNTTTAKIVDAQAFGEGLAILLNNGTVHYFTAASPSTKAGNPLTVIASSLPGPTTTSPGGILQTLNVNGEHNLRIAAMSCDYWTCCFRSYNGTLWCWGSLGASPPLPLPKPLVETIDQPTPTITFTDPGFLYLSVMSSRAGLINSRIDGTVHFVEFDLTTFTVKNSTDITGDFAGFDSRKFTSGVSHLAVLTGTNGILVSGLDDGANGLVSGTPFGSLTSTPLPPLRWFHNDVFTSNVVDISSSLYTLFWFTTDGNLWAAGLSIGDNALSTGNDWKPFLTPSLPMWATPTLIPYNSASYGIDHLYERRAYDERAMTVGLGLPRNLLLRAVVLAPPAPVSPPPPPPPAAACPGDIPFTTCTCVSGSWFCTGTIIPAAGAKIETNVVINGDLVISNPGITFVIPASSIASAASPADSALPFSQNKPLIDVSGCVSIETTLTVQLSTKQAVDAIPAANATTQGGKTINLIESRCKQAKNPASIINVSQTAKKCKHIASQVSEAASTITSGKTSLSILLKVSSNSCSYWWIILVSIIGCVGIVVPLVILAFYKIGILHSIIHPFKASNM